MCGIVPLYLYLFTFRHKGHGSHGCYCTFRGVKFQDGIAVVRILVYDFINVTGQRQGSHHVSICIPGSARSFFLYFITVKGRLSIAGQKKIPRRRITSREFFRLNSVSSLDFAGAQAARADINVLYGAVDNSLNTSDIGLPGSVAASVRVRNLYSESYTLTAVIAFSHDLNTSVIA